MRFLICMALLPFAIYGGLMLLIFVLGVVNALLH